MTVSAIPTASGCVAASVQLEALDGDKGVVGLGETTSGLIRYPTASEVRLYANGVSPAAQAGVALSSRLVGAWGAASEVCVNGTCAVGGATTMAAGSRVGFMDYYTWGWGLRAGNGIISRVQLDPVFTRCR